MTTDQERLRALEARLCDGFLKIGEAMSKGVEVTNWEVHWCQLLAEYVAIEDELTAAVPTQVGMAGMPRAEKVA